MSRIELTGLIGSHPLGALASFGLLRVLSEKDASARLSFAMKDDWIAVLDSGLGSADALLAFLKIWGAERAPEIFKAYGEDDVRVPPSAFREKLRGALTGDTENLELASFLVALAADGAEDKSKHLVKPTPFYMASANQKLLKTMRKLQTSVRQPGAWAEALLGPWRSRRPNGERAGIRGPSERTLFVTRHQQRTRRRVSPVPCGSGSKRSRSSRRSPFAAKWTLSDG